MEISVLRMGKRAIKWVSKSTTYFALGVITLFVLLLPVITKNYYFMSILSFACIYAIFAGGFDLLAGYTGQLNLGHAVFFGVGSYTAAFAVLVFGLSPLVAIPLGGLAAMGIALILGIPCLRLRGPYLLLTTAIFAMIVLSLTYTFSNITGGEEGIPNPRLYPGHISRLLPTIEGNYCLLLGFMLISLAILLLIVRSRWGLAFKTIRDDELTAEVIGVNTFKYKLLSFMLSGLFAGIAGSLFVFFTRHASPEATLGWGLMFSVLVMVMIGGWGTIVGAVFGAFIFVTFDTLLHDYAVVSGMYIGTLIWAIILILIIIFMPGGILRQLAPSIRKLSVKIRTSLHMKRG